MIAKGTLIAIGGNEDKGIETRERDQLEFIEASILARIMKESGGQNAKIVLVPTASNIPDQVVIGYSKAFETLGCLNFQVADIRKYKDVDNENNIRLIKEANCVLFSGGNQSKITENIRGTQLHSILTERYLNEKNFVIAGTSAGAMCMSEEMITGGGDSETFRKGAVRLGEGLGFIPNFIIDSHFIRRGRFGRLAEAVIRYPKFLGVGLAEDTALIVTNCNSFEVIGSGMVVIFDPTEMTYNDEPRLKVGEDITIANLKTHVLAEGTHFCLNKREIK